MSSAEPFSHPNLPRLFWPVALVLSALVAALLLIGPLAGMYAHDSTNYNEGWNAYHQQETIQRKPLYGAPPGLVGNNYPPISFHLIGLASRLTGDLNQTGRWVALLSLAMVAILCGAVVRRLTGSAPLAAYTALNVVIWLAVYKPDRIGMNDPQLLGTVFSLIGLYAYVREPDKLRWLCISAVAFTISVFTKHNLLAFPVAVGLHLLLRGDRKRLLVWGGVAAGGSALILALTLWLDGPYFLAHILVPRSRTSGLTAVTDYFTMFQLPVALAVVWSLRNMGQPVSHIMELSLIVAHALAAAFVGGDGVDRNIFFDCVLGLVVVGALVFAEYAPLFAHVKNRGFLLAALLVAPAFGIVIATPEALTNNWNTLRSLPARDRDFDIAVTLLRSRPGPALCENLLLCFEAGKPFTYDPYFTNSMVNVGRVKEEELVALVESASFHTVQLYLEPDEQNLTTGKRYRFTAKFMEALLKYYRVEARLGGSVVLVPVVHNPGS
jgi:hypothetical protein